MKKDLLVSELIEMQRKLQDKYQASWGERIEPNNGATKLLWGVGEIGEVIDIIKKHGVDAVMRDPEIRRALVEEMGDVMMYLFDVMLCYEISAEEFSTVYEQKHVRNMTRWDE